MALVNYATREISAKVVYYGPGLSGKTTNIQHVFSKVKPANKGKLISLSTQGDRTLFFDFLPVELGEIRGFKTRFHLYTVPGQVFYNSTRKLVLKGVDGIVFVADSQKMMMEENIRSLDNLRANLAEMGVRADRIPIVMQYNKRDLPNAATVGEMEVCLNSESYPYFEATALTGEGVLPTLTAIVKYILHDLRRDPGAHNIDFEAMMEEDQPADTFIEKASSPGPEPVPPAAEAGTVAAGGSARGSVPLPETAAEAAPGPGIEKAPVTKQTFILPLVMTTREGEMEVALSVSVEVVLHGDGAGSITRIEAQRPRPKEPPGVAGPAGLVAGAGAQEDKNNIHQKMLGMK